MHTTNRRRHRPDSLLCTSLCITLHLTLRGVSDAARAGISHAVTASVTPSSSFALPELPYAYDALEPWCGAETLHLHHDKHHKAYVDGANAAAEALAAADPGDATSVAALRANLVFNLGGHVLHSLFWENLSPQSTAPSGDLARRIDESFGSVDRAKALLKTACTGVQGSGWGVLWAEPLTGRLQVSGMLDHHHQHVPDARILAVIDVWEHAYYLDHRNDRAGWVAAAIDHLAWDAIAGRL